MRAIARGHQNRNLADFEKALKEYQHGEYPNDFWFRLVTNECSTQSLPPTLRYAPI